VSGDPEDLDADDRALLAAHVGGDAHALDDLLRRHRQRMWAVAVRTLGDPEEAADAVQDACLSAFRSAATYRGDAKVSTWLHRIVVNACLDRARRQAVRPTVPMPEQAPADPRDLLGERETGVAVQAALAQLPVEQRAAIVLVDLLGTSVEEAGQILDVPPGTVKSRCFRGRARLAVTLGHLRNPDSPRSVTPDKHPSTGPEGGLNGAP
jgi:RNA polymerase sigma-70 factor (ECF subfamily)